MAIPLIPILFAGKLGLATVVSLVGGKIATKLQSQKSYENVTPKLDPKIHLNGNYKREGLMQGVLGKVSKTFVSNVSIEWDQDQVFLQEIFTMGDGSHHTQNWTLFITGEKTLEGRGDDIEGKILGKLSGNSLRLSYSLRLPKSEGGYMVQVDDWYYLLKNGTFVNRAQYNKMGYPLAEISATLKKI